MSNRGSHDELFLRSDGVDVRTLPLVPHGITGKMCYDWTVNDGQNLTVWPPKNAEAKVIGTGFILIPNQDSQS